MITDLNNKYYICYLNNNITTNLNDNNHLFYVQNIMITYLNIHVIFKIK